MMEGTAISFTGAGESLELSFYKNAKARLCTLHCHIRNDSNAIAPPAIATIAVTPVIVRLTARLEQTIDSCAK